MSNLAEEDARSLLAFSIVNKEDVCLVNELDAKIKQLQSNFSSQLDEHQDTASKTPTTDHLQEIDSNQQFYDHYLQESDETQQFSDHWQETDSYQQTDDQEDQSLIDELELMKQMGLPGAFGSNTQMKRQKKKGDEQSAQPTKRQKMLNKQLSKFMGRAPKMFSRWNEIVNAGIEKELDPHMWYSITPEVYAESIARYCQEKTDYTLLVDGFCGVGGNLVQFALKNRNAFIIGIDLCPERIQSAKKIADIHGVQNQCDFICGDFLKVASSLRVKPDVVFLSPPWGGLEYKKKKKFLLKHLAVDGNEIFNVAKQLTKNIAYYLPRNQSLEDLDALCEDYSTCDNLSSDFGQTLNVYFGDLVDARFSREAILEQQRAIQTSNTDPPLQHPCPAESINEIDISLTVDAKPAPPKESENESSLGEILILQKFSDINQLIFHGLQTKRCNLM